MFLLGVFILSCLFLVCFILGFVMGAIVVMLAYGVKIGKVREDTKGEWTGDALFRRDRH